MSLANSPLQRQEVQIRWMIRRDLTEVLEIERGSFERAWTEDDFLACLRQRNCIGMVAERNDKIVGFMIYELLKSQLHLLNFAVEPTVRRQRVGTQLVEKLIHKLGQQHRQEITTEVRERNLGAQVFFRNQGMLAYQILKNYYVDSFEDAYVMKYRLLPAHNEPHAFEPRNRISEYEDAEPA